MKLVDDWKQSWRWVSMNCMVIAAAIQGAWMYIPDDLRDSFPRDIEHKIAGGLLILGIVGRLVKQS